MTYCPDWTEDRITNEYLANRHRQWCENCGEEITGDEDAKIDGLCEECAAEEFDKLAKDERFKNGINQIRDDIKKINRDTKKIKEITEQICNIFRGIR